MAPCSPLWGVNTYWISREQIRTSHGPFFHFHACLNTKCDTDSSGREHGNVQIPHRMLPAEMSGLQSFPYVSSVLLSPHKEMYDQCSVPKCGAQSCCFFNSIKFTVRQVVAGWKFREMHGINEQF